MIRYAVILVLFLGGCSSEVLQYIRAKHPGCDVTQLEETRDNVRVAIICPGKDPFEQTFRKR